MDLGGSPLGQIYAPQGGGGLELVLRAARSHLLGRADSEIAPLARALTATDGAWEDALATSHQNRLSGFVLAGLQSNGVAIPDPARIMLEHYRTTIFHMNTRNLMTIRLILPVIEAAGIEVVTIKGPVQQFLNYGEFFARPAGDVDLLVRSDDFLATRRIIEKAGYFLPRECASPWWRIFLGEQHFLANKPGYSTVDLHYRLQQPGAPSPRDLSSVLEGRQRVFVGGLSVPALASRDALLLQCMSLAKALIHREPAGSYAADLVAGLRRMTPEQFSAFAAAARAQGLRNTVRLALRGVEVLFGLVYDLNAPGEPRMLDHTTDDDLLGMLVTPADPAVVWPKRRTILWELNDAGPVSYSREVGWALGGEITRRLFQATPEERARAAPSAAAS